MTICNIEITLEIIEITLEIIEITLKFSKNVENVRTLFVCFDLFEFFNIFQKVFPRIPGGCRHKESDENRVFNNFYLSVGDICV